MENSYTTEELRRLGTMVIEHRRLCEDATYLGSIGALLRDIIVGAADRPRVVKDMLYQNTSRDIQRIMYELPFDDVPVYMGHSHPDIAAIANWRLLINK